MIVIPMAGESRRFRDAGYRVPKYELPVAGRPLFDWTVLSFASMFRAEPFLFIGRRDLASPNFVHNRVKELGISDYRIELLEGPTAGQAETVALGLAQGCVPMSEPLTIFNIDSIRREFAGVPIGSARSFDGWLEVFIGEGHGWSFVEADPIKPEIVVRTTEKERISNLCCTGMYYFRSRQTFETALAIERSSPSSSEIYIAPIYNHLIRSGSVVSYTLVDKDKVIFAGVPAEYTDLCANPGRLTGLA